MFDGKRLEEARKYRGVMQKELAKAIGVAPNTIYSYESGIINPKLETVEKIAVHLDVSVDFLLGLTETMTYSKNAEYIVLPKGFSKDAIPRVKEIIDLYHNKK